MRKKLFLLTLAFLCVLSVPGFSEDSKVAVKAEVDKAFLTVGDPITYTITVRHPKDVQVLSGFPAPDSEILKIKKVEDIHGKEDGMIVDGRKFTLTSFRLGEFVLEPVTVEYRDAAGQVHSVQTDKLYLTVKSVAEGEEKTDIKGVKGVLAITARIGWLLWLLGALMLCLGGFWAYRLTHRPLGKPEPEKPRLTAEEEAMIQLNQLQDSDLLRRGLVKEYHLLLSEILRIYFEKRFSILAVESTTTEISRLLRDKDVDPKLREKIIDVLDAADLAKFAKWKPDPATILGTFNKARQIVDDCRPHVSAPPAMEEKNAGV